MERAREGRRTVRQIFIWALEIVAVTLSFLQRSHIARFLTAKVGMDTVVEVTRHLGADAGHSLSTFVALLVADPRLIAVFIAGCFLIINFIAGIVSWNVRRRRRRNRRPRKVSRY